MRKRPTSREVGEHYDELDAFYRELWGEHLHHGLWATGDETPEEATVALVSRVAEAAGIGPGDRVCDVGCGYGATAELLRNRRGARVTGFTVSRGQWRRAETRARGTGGLRFVLGDWLENDLPADRFDAVVAIESTEHMAPKPRALAEAWRVLRPGGRLVVCAWTVPAGLGRWRRRHLVAPLCREGRLAGLATPEDYRRWSGAAGFRAVRTEDLTRRVQRTWRVVLIRVAGTLATGTAGWRYLLDARRRHRSFAKAVLRIPVAYRLGALRYTLLTARKPPERRG